jgi:hypothetical protein
VRRIGSLVEGDVFMLVLPNEVDMRGHKHPPGRTYRVIKVYPQSPFARVTTAEGCPGSFSFLPGLIVRDPNEPEPDEEDIRRFLEPKIHRTVVGYELLWDGLSQKGLKLSPRVRGLLETWLSVAPGEVESNALYRLLNTHFHKFSGEAMTTLPSKLLQYYSRRLSNMGLVRVMYADDDYGRAIDRISRSISG